MNGPDISFYSILPPVLVLVLGYLTKRVLWSLFSGLLLGAYIAKGADLLESLSYCGYTVIKNLELEHFKSLEAFWGSWNALICLFLIILGILITLIHHSGGAFCRRRLAHGRLFRQPVDQHRVRFRPRLSHLSPGQSRSQAPSPLGSRLPAGRAHRAHGRPV